MEREREREREKQMIFAKIVSRVAKGEKNCCNCKVKENITTSIAKENSWPHYFYLYPFFKRKNEIRDYF